MQNRHFWKSASSPIPCDGATNLSPQTPLFHRSSFGHVRGPRRPARAQAQVQHDGACRAAWVRSLCAHREEKVGACKEPPAGNTAGPPQHGARSPVAPGQPGPLVPHGDTAHRAPPAAPPRLLCERWCRSGDRWPGKLVPGRVQFVYSVVHHPPRVEMSKLALSTLSCSSVILVRALFCSPNRS